MKTTQQYKIGDCLELLPSIQDKSVDLIITDLPYGMTACAWDTPIDLDKLWFQYKRIITYRGAIVLFGSQPFTSALVMSNPSMFRYEWIWDKRVSGNPFLGKVQPMKTHENILVFYKNHGTYNPIREEKNIETINREKRNIFAPIKSEHFKMDRIKCDTDTCYPKSIQYFKKVVNNQFKKSRIHSTQKPTPLIEYLIKTYTNPGDTVHDSCLGSGTTMQACVNLNRNFTGFELSDEWVWNYKKILDSKKNMHKLSKVFGREL